MVQLVSYFAEQPMTIEQELCDQEPNRFDFLVRTMGDRFGPASRVLSCHCQCVPQLTLTQSRGHRFLCRDAESTAYSRMSSHTYTVGLHVANTD